MKHPSTPRSRGNFPGWMALLAMAAVLSLTACMRDGGGGVTGNGGSGTHDAVNLSGRVVDKNGAPLSGVVVVLARGGVRDTTDAQGKYRLEAPTVPALGKASAAASVLDTLLLLLNGQRVVGLDVTSWLDSFPDVGVIQRDIDGLLPAGAASVTKVEAVITGDGIPSGSPLVAQFFHNPLSSNYSGFVYFPLADSVLNYSVTINVYGDSGQLVGRSVAVAFNNHAGDITVPTFEADNAVPVANAGNDTTVKVGSSVALHGVATDAFGGTIAKREWSIGGAGFVTTSSGDTSITAPSVRTSGYLCILRVTDNDGNTDLDTVSVTAINDNPAASALTDTLVALGTSLTLRASATDPEGVRRYLWDFDGDGANEDTTTADSVTHVFPGTPQTDHVILTVQDNFDGQTQVSENVFVMDTSVGFSWSDHSYDTTTIARPIHSTIWTGSLAVATTTSGGILTSPDGLTWTKQVVGGGASIMSVAWSGSMFATVGSASGTVFSSPDAVTWTSRSLGGSGPASWSVCWAGTQFVAGDLNAAGIYTSPDGITWSHKNTGLGSDFISVAWTGSKLVGAENNGDIAVSSDGGLHWSKVFNGTGLQTVTWTGTQLVATGRSNTLYTSPDGTAWTGTTVAGSPGQIRSAAQVGSQVFVAADSGLVVSPDAGAHWILTHPLHAVLKSVAFTGTRLVATGLTGKIITSP